MTLTGASTPSNSSSPDRLNKVGIIAALAILWSLGMTATFTVWVPYWFQHRFDHQIDSPVLALELARNQADIDAVLQRSDPNNPDPQKTRKAQKALYWNTVLDCVFIPLYSGYMLLFGFAYHPRGFHRRALVVLTAATALADYAENACMFLALAGRVHSVYIPSLLKWSLLGLVLILLTTLLLSENPGPYSLPTRRLLGLGHITAGALILMGVVFSHYSWLALGVELFAFTLVINAIGLLGPVLALPGARQEFQTDFCEKRGVTNRSARQSGMLPLARPARTIYNRTALTGLCPAPPAADCCNPSAVYCCPCFSTPPSRSPSRSLERSSFQGGKLNLHGFLAKPDGLGPFPAVLWNHGSEKSPGAQRVLATFYTAHSYVFFIPHRRGQGRSPGNYIQDLIAQSPPSERGSRMVELQEVEVDDVAAALDYLKSQPFVDPARIAISGCSYGGIQTLLAGERDLGVKALVPLAPSRALAKEAEKKHKDFQSKIYPPLGTTPQEGHWRFCSTATDVWGDDVLAFLEAHIKSAK